MATNGLPRESTRVSALIALAHIGISPALVQQEFLKRKRITKSKMTESLLIPEANHVKDIMGKHLVISDWQAVDILLATIASHKLPGNMLWLRLIGASGSGKSEILKSLLSQNDYCTAGEAFTPSAIRRGYNPEGKMLPRMLDRWNTKLVITKDFAAMLTKRSEDRIEVFGLLRSVWDGELDADYGSDEGHIKQKSHFDWIIGTTSYVESQSTLEGLLGTRFIDLRWGRPIDSRSAVVKAISNNSQLNNIRPEFDEAMQQFIAAIDPLSVATIQDATWLADIANLTGKMRTVVVRDKWHDVTDIPEPEVATRLGQTFAKIVNGLSLIGIYDYKPYITRLAKDCLPSKRRGLVECHLSGVKSNAKIANILGISKRSVEYHLDDLEILGIKLNGEVSEFFKSNVQLSLGVKGE